MMLGDLVFNYVMGLTATDPEDLAWFCLRFFSNLGGSKLKPPTMAARVDGSCVSGGAPFFAAKAFHGEDSLGHFMVNGYRKPSFGEDSFGHLMVNPIWSMGIMRTFKHD